MTSSKTPAAVVIGGGTMGADVAIVLARGGWQVAVVEPSEARRAALPAYWAAELATTGHDASAGLLASVAALEDAPWTDVRFVVECAPERLDVKRDAFSTCDRLAHGEAILASNSSSFPISQIAEGLSGAARMIGLHFFMPAHVTPLVEVVSGPETSAETAARTMAIMRDCGRRPVHVKKDLPGFLANRMQHALAREAFALIEAGVASAEDVDAAVRFGFGFRFLAAGPALQRDLAGLDVHCAAAVTMYPSLARNETPSAELTERVARGDFGMKTGSGFFDWTPETAAAERVRYASALQAGLAVIAEELPPVRPVGSGDAQS